MARTKPAATTDADTTTDYIAVCAVEHDGERYAPGEALSLTAASAKSLLAIGAIKPVDTPEPAAA